MPRHVPLPTGLGLAMVAGLALALQSRITGTMGQRLDDGLAAALVSFGSGLLVMVLLTLGTRAGRAGASALRGALSRRELPPWYLAAGTIGASLVLGQGVAVGTVGVALFTIALVAGQTVGGLLVDRVGFGAGGRKRLTAPRLAGSVLTLAAVAWAVSAKFTTLGPGAPALLLLPLLAGLFYGFQQAMNGRIGAVAGTPLTPTLTNFAAGTVVLLAAWLIKLPFSPPAHALPHDWWLYSAGPLGIVVVFLSAALVRRIGVLLLGLGGVAGQLVGSVLLDLAFPSPVAAVGTATVLGTALTLIAVVIAAAP
ncbi:DMT family transporter [Arthrobacter sp. STN4]|uniref:DMT family transporter n=1 Tax=Arthrobacter sp. STN4 TaxID=2923276 RepID=UPI00211A36FB|nr:DMT family transporter [Arthrobacter sp. STN4]MCQ9163551.1 DMT family transporter [Arthrobacter sp. STN4]